MNRTARSAALFAAVFALAACEAGDTNLPATDVDVLAFSYGGPMTGSWRAEGRLDVPRANETTWAAGVREGGRLEIQAILQRADGLHDWVSITLPRTTPGSVEVDPTCAGEDSCPRAFIAFGMRNVDGTQAEVSCPLQSGTLRLTEIGGGRAKGTFSGAGDCITNEGDFMESFTVTGGSFDVPLR